MSMRTIARSSSKRKSASALASSVLPVPVGPRKRNDPVGRLGSAMPARERRTASLTARDGVALADQALADHRLHLEQLGGLALQHPAGGDAGPGLDDVGDLLGADLVADERVEVDRLGLSRPRRSASPARGSAVVGSRWRRRGRPRAAACRPRSAAGRAGGAARPRPRAGPSPAPSGPRARAAPPRGRRGPCAARRAARPRRRRSPWRARTPPSSAGRPGGGAGRSPRARTRAPSAAATTASSIRSIALSGSWRPVM